MSNLYHILGNLSGYNPFFLRHKIANYMINNPTFNGEPIDKLIKSETGMELDEYVGNIRKHDTHFSSYEIKAYCDSLSRNVILYYTGNKVIFYAENTNDIYDNLKYDGNNYS